MSKMRANGQIINYNRVELLKKSKNELVKIILDIQDFSIPIGIFSTELSPLASLVKYLHEEKKLQVNQIAKLLNRNSQTIYTIIRLNKDLELDYPDLEYSIPLNKLAKENNSVLETVSAYLHDSQNLGFTQISKLLHRSTKTIWTSYSRLKIKGGIK